LCGNYRILNETETFRIRRKPIHATTPPVNRIGELMLWAYRAMDEEQKADTEAKNVA
jgi:hypothetical protein